jgi:hypothetical protein
MYVPKHVFARIGCLMLNRRSKVSKKCWRDGRDALEVRQTQGTKDKGSDGGHFKEEGLPFVTCQVWFHLICGGIKVFATQYCMDTIQETIHPGLRDGGPNSNVTGVRNELPRNKKSEQENRNLWESFPYFA